MKTIGEYLKESRAKKKFSLVRLVNETKIKREFIIALEREDWGHLPDYAVVIGFTKKISRALKISEDNAVALLRRDYPPKPESVNPKPDVSKKFVWSPRTTFFLGVVLVVLSILGYLSFQYVAFISPPSLVIHAPQDHQVFLEGSVAVVGMTDADTVVVVNNQPVLVDSGGEFSVEIDVLEQTSEIVVSATSRSGKETTIVRNIVVELEK